MKLVLRAEMAGQGLGFAHIHVRLNASQVHNAIRKTIGMEAPPDDPAHRRSYLAGIGRLLDCRGWCLCLVLRSSRDKDCNNDER